MSCFPALAVDDLGKVALNFKHSRITHFFALENFFQNVRISQVLNSFMYKYSWVDLLRTVF